MNLIRLLVTFLQSRTRSPEYCRAANIQTDRSINNHSIRTASNQQKTDENKTNVEVFTSLLNNELKEEFQHNVTDVALEIYYDVAQDKSKN